MSPSPSSGGWHANLFKPHKGLADELSVHITPAQPFNFGCRGNRLARVTAVMSDRWQTDFKTGHKFFRWCETLVSLHGGRSIMQSLVTSVPDVFAVTWDAGCSRRVEACWQLTRRVLYLLMLGPVLEGVCDLQTCFPGLFEVSTAPVTDMPQFVGRSGFNSYLLHK